MTAASKVSAISLPRLLQSLRSPSSQLVTFALLAAERMVQMAVGMLVIATIARAHSLEDFASWQIAYSMWVVVCAISGITGERVVLPRMFGAKTQEELQTVLRTALAAKAVSGAGACVLLLGWAALQGNAEVFALALVWSVHLLLFEPIAMATTESYGNDDFVKPQIARLIGLVVRASVVIGLWAVGGSLLWYVTAWILELLACALILCRPWLHQPWRFRGPVALADLRDTFVRGAALAAAPAATAALSRVDRLVFNDEIPVEGLAQYAAALSLLEALFGFAAILATVAGAKVLYRAAPIRPLQHLRAVVEAAGIGAAGAALLAWQAPAIARLVFGVRFVDTALYLQYAAWLLPLAFVQWITQAPLVRHSSSVFHVARSLTGLAVGAAVVALVVPLGRIEWICAGAYAGFAAMIAIDAIGLHRRRDDIYA